MNNFSTKYATPEKHGFDLGETHPRNINITGEQANRMVLERPDERLSNDLVRNHQGITNWTIKKLIDRPDATRDSLEHISTRIHPLQPDTIDAIIDKAKNLPKAHQVTSMVAMRPDLTPEHADRLIDLKSISTNTELTTNPHLKLTDSQLSKIADTPSMFGSLVHSNYELTPQIHDKIMHHLVSNPNLAPSISQTKGLPEHHIETLMNHPEITYYDRSKMALNQKNLSPKHLSTLIGEGQGKFLLNNPHFSEEMKEQIRNFM
jgi:hypothetical protein